MIRSAVPFLRQGLQPLPSLRRVPHQRRKWSLPSFATLRTLAPAAPPSRHVTLLRSVFLRPRLPNASRPLPRAGLAGGPSRPFHHGSDAFAKHFRDSRLLKWVLVGLNAGVFLAWSTPSCRPFLERHFLLSDRNILDGRWWAAIGCSFLHPHPLHLVANMVALHASLTMLARIGLNVFRHQIPLMVGGALAGSAASIWYKRRSGSADRPSAGASSYVCSMFTSLALMRPHSVVYAFYVIRVPMWMLVAGLTVFDLATLKEDSILNHQGHLGGSAFGALFWAAILRRRFGGAF